MGELPATRVYRGIRDEKPAPSGGVARADLCLADAAVDELLTRIAELEAEVQHQIERREEEKLRAVLAEAERDKWADSFKQAEAALEGFLGPDGLCPYERERDEARDRFRMLRMLGSNAKYDEWTRREAQIKI